MSRTPNWLLDFALTSAHWLWRNKWLVAMVVTTTAVLVVLIMKGAKPV